MTLRYSVALRNARLDAITTLAGSGALLNIYNGTMPATTGGTATTLLAQLTISGALAASASGAVLAVNTITNDSSANASGTATWFRLTTSGGTFVLEGTVGTSGADLNIDNTTITAGVGVAVTSWTLTGGNP